MNKKRGQKREIKEYHSFELVIAVGLLVYWSVGLLVVGHWSFLYLVAPKGAFCLSDYPAVGHCCRALLGLSLGLLVPLMVE